MEQRHVHPAQRSLQRFSIRQVALHDLDSGQPNLVRFGRVAYQGAESDAARRKFLHDVKTTMTGPTCDEDHEVLLAVKPQSNQPLRDLYRVGGGAFADLIAADEQVDASAIF